MTISELICQLEAIKKEHGDLEVEYSYNDCGYILTGSSYISEIVVETEYMQDKKVVIA